MPQTLYLFCWIILLGSLTTRGQEVLVGPVTNKLNGSIYYLLSQSSWTQARAKARQLGGDLVSIDDAFEDHFLSVYFGCYRGQPQHLWIGLADLDGDGTMEWVNGSRSTYRHWFAGRPSQPATNPYTLIRYWFDGWDNFPDLAYTGSVYEPHGIVEIPNVAPKRASPPPLTEATLNSFKNRPRLPLPRTRPVLPAVREEPLTNARNGHVYYVLEPSTWTVAAEAARYLGGYLFVPEDRDEEVLVHQRFSIRPDGTRRDLWIGYSDMDFDGRFEWIAAEQSSYTNWLPGQPDLSGSIERFAYMLAYDRAWNDFANDPTKQWGPGVALPSGVVEMDPARPAPLPADAVALELTPGLELHVRKRSPLGAERTSFIVETTTNLNRPWIELGAFTLRDNSASMQVTNNSSSGFYRARVPGVVGSESYLPPFAFEHDMYVGFPGTNVTIKVRDARGRAVPDSLVQLGFTEYYAWGTAATNLVRTGGGVRVLSGPPGLDRWKILRISGRADGWLLDYPAMFVLYPTNNDYTVFSSEYWRLALPAGWIRESTGTFASFPAILDLGDFAQVHIMGAKWQDLFNETVKAGFNHETHYWDCIVEDPLTCGYNGVPLGVGRDCYRGPGGAWFMLIFHERGHNSQWVTPAYGDVLGRTGFYGEAEANVLARWSIHVALNSDLVDQPSKDRLLYQWIAGTVGNMSALQRQALGEIPYDDGQSYPVWEGCFIYLAEELDIGWDIVPRYVKTWIKDDEITRIIRGADGSDQWRENLSQVRRATYAVAAISAAASSDLRTRFREWRFPIDDSLFEQLYQHWVLLLEN